MILTNLYSDSGRVVFLVVFIGVFLGGGWGGGGGFMSNLTFINQFNKTLTGQQKVVYLCK